MCWSSTESLHHHVPVGASLEKLRTRAWRRESCRPRSSRGRTAAGIRARSYRAGFDAKVVVVGRLGPRFLSMTPRCEVSVGG